MSCREVEGLYDAISSDYDFIYDSEECERENAFIQSRLIGQSKGCGNILDVGCGTGLGYELLSTRVNEFEYKGIDISQNMVNKAKAKYGSELFESGCASEYLWQISKADFVFALFGVASYLPESVVNSILCKDNFFIMFYSEGYRPEYHTSDIEIRHASDYGLGGERFKNWFIVSSE